MYLGAPTLWPLVLVAPFLVFLYLLLIDSLPSESGCRVCVWCGVCLARSPFFSFHLVLASVHGTLTSPCALFAEAGYRASSTLVTTQLALIVKLPIGH